MTSTGTRTVEHEIRVQAGADAVYRLIADVANWPQIFPPSVHVEHLERGDRQERIQIWATANGEAKTWQSRRVLDPAARRVEFRQEVSQPPVAAMAGTWIIEDAGQGASRVRLLHEFRAVDDEPDKLEWIDRAVDTNSTAELAALKVNAELATGDSGLLFTFDDKVHIDGSAKDLYEFINQAQLWEQRLPHVARVSLREDSPGLQLLEMDTRAKDGSVHTTSSVRVCLPYEKIVYKQIVLPALMTLHTGQWLFEEQDSGVAVTSRHTVAINEANIARVLGADATVADTRDYLHTALSTNSLATLQHARRHVEGTA